MVAWLVRLFSIVGGVIAGWLVGRDAPNYSLIQTVVTLLLIVAVVALLAFWPWRRKRRDTSGDGDRA